MCLCLVCLSVCVCLCAVQRSCPCLSFLISWFPNSTFPICLFEPWRRQPCAGLPSPRQAGRLIRVFFFFTLDKSQKMGRPAFVLASEHEQQSPASSLTLPQQQDHQTSMQTQSASSQLDQPQGGLGYQPTGYDSTRHRVGWASASPLGTIRPHLQETTSTATATVDAQLTPPIIQHDDTQRRGAPRVQDAPMPDAPAVHDIDTPRRQIGSRCRKWCISIQPASDKRNCAARCMCGQQFSHGEARLQQWCNRNTQRACVHAHCVNGGVHHDHELHPKQPLDQEAVEFVARQRESVIRAAADTEVLLPIASSLHCCPCLDVKKLSAWMDEEIMDFQWFDNISWDSIKDLRGTTYVQPPPRFKFALQQAQHAILRAIMHHNPSSLASDPSMEGTGARQLAPLGNGETALTTWRPGLISSGLKTGQLSGLRCELNVMLRLCTVRPRRTATEQKQSRIRKVATLARSGEKGRALAAARNAPPVPVTGQSVQEIKSLFPTDPEPLAPAQTIASNLLLSEVAELIPTTLRKMPRLTWTARHAC